MKTKLFALAITCCLFYYTYGSISTVEPSETTQTHVTDSALIKMVRGIFETVKSRYKPQLPKLQTEYVIIDKQGSVPIDSLYKYDFKDFKQLAISFDENAAVYGAQADVGIIRLYRK